MFASVGVWGKRPTVMAGHLSALQHIDFDHAWCRTIFCKFENRTLKNALEDYAQRTGCTVEFARISYPDLLEVGAGFVNIFDLTTFALEAWQI